MNSSILQQNDGDQRKRLFDSLRALARQRFASDAQWARASGIPAETLSRLRTRLTCDVRTLWALADGAGCTLVAVPVVSQANASRQQQFGREDESALIDLCASRNLDSAHWRALGDAFLMGGLATLLASAHGFDRARYLRLAESLHAGVTTPEVFALWLKRSPIRPARFLPMLRARLAHASR
jgi:hypothetical protein